MQDIRLTIRREIEKMDGFAKWNGTANPDASQLRGGFDMQKWDTITRRLVLASHNKVWTHGQKSNILSANQSDVETNTAGFLAIGGGTITRDTNNYYQGTASFKVVTGAVNGDGGKVDTVSASAATQYTASVHLKGTSGDVVKIVLRDNTNATETSTTITMNGQWQRKEVSHTTGALAVTDLEFHLINNAAATITFYADAFQIEANSFAGHWTRGGDSGWTAITPSGITNQNTFLEDGFWDFALADDLLVMCNGLDKPYFWDGLGTVALTLGGDVWETFQHRPSVIASATEQVINEELFSISGANGALSHYRYRFFGNVWDSRLNPVTDTYARAGFVLEGLLHVAGGNAQLVHDVYDPIKNTWDAAGSLPAVRSFAGGEALGIYGYVYGGIVAGAAVATGVKFTTLTNAWSAIANLNVAVNSVGHAQGNDLVFKMGGIDTAPAYRTDIEAYNADDNAWTARIGLNTARDLAASFTLSGGGGYAGGEVAGPTNSAINEIHDFLGNVTQVVKAITSATNDLQGMGAVLNGIGHFSGGTAAGVSISFRYVPFNSHVISQFAVFFQGVLFTAGDTANPSRLNYTDLHKIRTQRANAFIDLPLDRITSLFAYQNSLYALSRDGGVRVNGTTFDPDPELGNQYIEQVPQMPGCVSHRSVVSVSSWGLMFWWSEEGPVLWDGNRPVNLARRYVNGEPRGLQKFFAATANFDQSFHKHIVGHHKPDTAEVWWWLSTASSIRDVAYIYNYEIDEWCGPINIRGDFAMTAEDMNTDLPLIFIGGTLGFAYQLGTGTDYNGSNINGRYRTDFMTFGDMRTLKDYDHLYTMAKQSGAWNLTIKTFRDWSTTADATKTEVLSGTNKVLETPIAGESVNALQLEWSNATKAEPFTVIGAQIGLNPAPEATVS